MANATFSIIKEECFLDEMLHELPNRLAKPPPSVKANNLSFPKLFHQISDSLKDIQLTYTCFDASSLVLALGTNVGNAFLYQRNHKKILKMSSETKYVPTTCIKLATGCGMVAFAHETGTFSVGVVDPPIHCAFDSLTAQDIHHSSVTCLEWSTDGLILYAGDSDGKISMSVVKISEGILQTAIIITEDVGIVQLSYASDALLISTTKRTKILSFQTEKLTQVGEKERKTTGCFGCCFIPDDLQESSKKLYTARPGQRIWTADESGKVSSTSVFKSLLADKPQTIYTLTGNDSKMNSGGQFGQLIMYYNKFVVTWDQNHLWILDLNEGTVVGCHSNLGKIHNVAVSGHELFVLSNQKERFLRRFALVSEDVGPTCLDAVIAIREGVVKTSPTTVPEFKQNSATGIEAVVVGAKSASLVTEDKENKDKQLEAPIDNVFQKINSIPLECGKGDIVFTKGKQRKKKKKVKPAAVSDETKTVTEHNDISELRREPTPEPNDDTSFTSNETMGRGERSVSPLFGSFIAKGENMGDPTSLGKLERPKDVITVEQEEADGKPHTVNTHEVVASNQVIPDVASTDEGKQTAHELNEAAKVSNDDHVKELSSNEQDTDYIQKEVNDAIVVDHNINMTTETLGLQDVHGDVKEVHLDSDVPVVISGKVSPDNQCVSLNDSVVSTVSTESHIPTSQMHESLESGDELPNSNYLRNDSYELSEKRETPSEVNTVVRSESLQKEGTDQDYHVPLFADTWSRRALPTAHAVESVAISENHIFCVDVRGEVYYSDPNSASCTGWEQVGWKATQLCVDGHCHLISYVQEDNKAFVRANVSKQHPVGNKSYQIMEDVSLLALCSVCTWAITTNGELKRINSSTLLELKRDITDTKIWRHEDSQLGFCQIACYNNVLWGRTLDESLFVGTGCSKGKKTMWEKVEEMKAKWISMSDDGTIWIITPDEQIWFNPGASMSSSTEDVWYQVTLGDYIIDEDPSIVGSAMNFFHSMGSAYRSARATEYLRHAAKGFIQSTKDMAFSLFRDGGAPKQVYCNMKGGVWLLDTKNTLHACRGQVTGTHWKLVCPTGTAQSATWCQLSTGIGNYVWALQPNGELTCFNPKGPSYNVAGPSSISLDFISGSPHGVWSFDSEKPSRIHIRDGISDSYPQGFAWFSLKLRDQNIEGVRHISVGEITVWAVDDKGHVWIRLGSVSGDQSCVLSQVWLPLDEPLHAEFNTVEVNAKDSIVWAIDTKGNVYARDGVKENCLVGDGWREVSGPTLKNVCLSSCVVYGLCTNGEIVCRFGVSPNNCVGDYWKKIPGEFDQISVNSSGELWAVSEYGRLFVRKTKCLFGKVAAKEVEDPKEKNTHVDSDWELL